MKDEVLEICPRCKRALKMRFHRDYLEEPWTVSCICDCMDEDRTDEFQPAPIGESFHNIIRDQRFKEAVFEKDDLKTPKVTTHCKEYVIHFKQNLKNRKNGLVLFGETGVGKSFFAACVGNALLDYGFTVLATTLPRLSADVKFGELNEQLHKLKQYQALIIDDWGIERKTEYMDEFMQTIVDERYRQGLPIILTTNRNRDQIIYPADAAERRILSRLAEMADFVPVKGEDRRIKGNL